jgi:ABC-2 type transport system ATP-binding protein
MSSPPVLEIESLTKTFRSSFGRREVCAVHQLSLQVAQGSVVAFVGPNGAGKTTTILSILGFLHPEQGRITIFGEPAGSVAARRRIGFQSEIFYTYPFHTARRALDYYGKLSKVPNTERGALVDRQLQRLGLAEAADRKVRTFSKGMIQRLGLAQALVHEPELLILDEPTTGLDPEGRKLVAELILEEKARGHTVLLSSHILSDAERTCDWVVMIRKGEVVLSEDMKRLSQDSDLWEVEILAGQSSRDALVRVGFSNIEATADSLVVTCSSEQKRQLLRFLAERGIDVGNVKRSLSSLEDLYMEYVGSSSNG